MLPEVRRAHRSPCTHSRDDEPDHPGVDEQVADAQKLADRRRDRDDVGEERQDVVVAHPMVLAVPLFLERSDDLGLIGFAKGVHADGHASVHRDDHGVADQTEQDERHAGQPHVGRSEDDQERVGDAEGRRAHEEVVPCAPFRKREELDPEARDGEPPPAQPEVLEVRQPAAEGVAGDDSEHEEGYEELH
jgi:hypothetical protein